MIPHFQEYATTPRAGESARVGVRKRVVLLWYTTHAAVEYRDGNRALVAKDKVTRAKFSMTAPSLAALRLRMKLLPRRSTAAPNELRKLHELNSAALELETSAAQPVPVP